MLGDPLPHLCIETCEGSPRLHWNGATWSNPKHWYWTEYTHIHIHVYIYSYIYIYILVCWFFWPEVSSLKYPFQTYLQKMCAEQRSADVGPIGLHLWIVTDSPTVWVSRPSIFPTAHLSLLWLWQMVAWNSRSPAQTHLPQVNHSEPVLQELSRLEILEVVQSHAHLVVYMWSIEWAVYAMLQVSLFVLESKVPMVQLDSRLSVSTPPRAESTLPRSHCAVAAPHGARCGSAKRSLAQMKWIEMLP